MHYVLDRTEHSESLPPYIEYSISQPHVPTDKEVLRQWVLKVSLLSDENRSVGADWN